MSIVVASGKRKTAIARAIIKPGIGRVRINSIPLEVYEPKFVRMLISEPLLLLDEKTKKMYDIDVIVQGGGFMGQAQAIRTAIARGLIKITNREDIKALYSAYDRSLIVSDPRQAEPKKPRGRSARAKRQKSYR
ncbi:MAG: 30S ribosomal protein S9 [Thermoprotei archaeon]|jgi:small subunit ribosomal protein S9